MRALAVRALGLAFYAVLAALCAAVRFVKDAGEYASRLWDERRGL